MKKITIILFIFIFTFAFTSCGGEKDPTSAGKDPAPTDIAKSFLQAVKDQDKERLAAVYAGAELDFFELADADDLPDEIEQLLTEKFLGFDYEVSHEEINEEGTEATVDVAVTTYDMGEAFGSFIESYLTQAFTMAFSGASEEEMEELAETMIREHFEDMTEKNYTKTVSLPLEKFDGQWKVSVLSEDAELLDAMSGGLLQAAKDFSDTFNDAFSDGE